jgi:hypothetical protein
MGHVVECVMFGILRGDDVTHPSILASREGMSLFQRTSLSRLEKRGVILNRTHNIQFGLLFCEKRSACRYSSYRKKMARLGTSHTHLIRQHHGLKSVHSFITKPHTVSPGPRYMCSDISHRLALQKPTKNQSFLFLHLDERGGPPYILSQSAQVMPNLLAPGTVTWRIFLRCFFAIVLMHIQQFPAAFSGDRNIDVEKTRGA